MPEAPELAGVVAFLARRCTGSMVSGIQLSALSAVKTAAPPLQSLVGASVSGVSRRGKYLIIETSAALLVVHLSRAGWLVWRDHAPQTPLRPGRGRVAARISFVDSDGVVTGCLDLTEAGTQKRLAIWVAADLADIEQLSRLGPEAGELTTAGLDTILDGAGAVHLKTVLRDQAAMAGIGNAYSDEILHAAKLSPARRASSLDEAERVVLLETILDTLARAQQAAQDADDLARLKDTKRQHFRVHGRAGEACPVCGDTIASVSSGDSSYQYCPTCQTGGRRLADHRLSRLLK